MREQLHKLCEQYGCRLETDVKLSQHTTFRIGGTADFWAEITCIEGMQALLRFCREEGIPYFVLGKGSNVLASDDGYHGVILHLGNAFSEISVSGTTRTCQAGAGRGAAARIAAEHGLTGMETLSGIPGTIGGALYMNAGAYGGEMKDVVTSCEYLTAEGELRTMELAEMELSYRHSILRKIMLSFSLLRWSFRRVTRRRSIPEWKSFLSRERPSSRWSIRVPAVRSSVRQAAMHPC